ncbi:hypothetical protein ACRQ5Q_14760 [Bradyrhizobium sp. PMVTL-01]
MMIKLLWLAALIAASVYFHRHGRRSGHAAGVRDAADLFNHINQGDQTNA